MKFSDFLKDKILLILLCSAAIAIAELFMNLYKVNTEVRLYTGIVFAAALVTGLMVEFVNKRRFYNELYETLGGLDEKYYISELVHTPSFTEGEIICDVLKESERSRVESVRELQRQIEDYRAFLELWIHEVKLPIATAELIIKNNPGEVSQKLSEELLKIEAYIEQALFYARSNTVEKDYMIVKCVVKDVLNPVIRKNKNRLIGSGIKILTENTDTVIYTDGKWLGFIIGQLINNSIEYMQYISGRDDVLEISCKEFPDSVYIAIRDNGRGIKPSELPRIFEKGFTGINGRRDGRKATGIGLYLCKKLCDKMNIGIEAFSEEEKFTEIRLTVPKGSFLRLEPDRGGIKLTY